MTAQQEGPISPRSASVTAPVQPSRPTGGWLRQLAGGGWPILALVVVVLLGIPLGLVVGDRLGSGGGSPGVGRSGPVVPAVHVVTDPRPLAWPPPELVDPETVVVDADHNDLDLDPDRDYRVVLPTSDATVLVGGVTIVGGHHVVIIGGVIAVPSLSRYPDRDGNGKDRSAARRGLYLKGQTGTVHVEGVHFTGDLSDAINLDQREGAVVQLENLRVDPVLGGRDLHHADVIQTWAGPRILRVDGLQAATQYQGLFLLPNQQFERGPAPESFTFRRTVISVLPNSGYALWLPRSSPWLDWSGLTLRPLTGREPARLTWPDEALGVRVVGETDAVQLPAGTPGGHYVTPGYAAAG